LSGQPLLFYVAHASDPHAVAVAPALAAVAERAGWGFECYYDALRKGRHFGGGDPGEARPGWPSGGLVAGGLHLERVLRLGARYRLTALGDPSSVLWPTLEAAGAETLARSLDPAELYASAFRRLGEDVPPRVLVLDRGTQGPNEVVSAPYLYPAFWSGGPALGIDVSAGPTLHAALEHLGAKSFRGLYVGPERARSFQGGLEGVEGDVGEKTYAELTSELADRHAGWARGVLLGDPELVAAQLPKALRLRLVPLYGRPQVEVIERARDVVRAGSDPVFGRQFDDRDFFALGRLGKSLQVVDPGPPFDSAWRPRAPSPAAGEHEHVELGEPSDDELERWAAEKTVVATVLLWSGMIREVDCLPRLIDLVALTGLRAGLVLTSEAIAHADESFVELLATPVERGGVLGQLEPLLGSAGRGVAAEAEMPPEEFAAGLSDARAEAVSRLPPPLHPRGWWPLLDAPLRSVRSSPVSLRSGRPAVRFTPRGEPAAPDEHENGGDQRDARALAGRAVRSLGLEALFEERRPFDDQRPGDLDRAIAASVSAAGFSYMWSKASFGRPRVPFRAGDFVALSLTAGNWDGWSPFYTAGSARDLVRAEKRLLRGGAGWLATTVDSPLFALSGEVQEHGSRLYGLADLLARGGSSGRLVNVTPNVVARYARLLASRGSKPDPALS